MELLPTREVVKRTGRSTSSVSRWVAEGVLTPVLRGEGIRGGMWFWSKDIDDLCRRLEAEKAEAAG